MKKILHSIYGCLGIIKRFVKNKKKLSVAIFIVIIACALFSFFGAGQKKNGNQEHENVGYITRETIEYRIKVKGTVESLNSQNIFVPVEAAVKELHVKRGDKVEKGQLLAVFDTTQIDAQIEKAEINLDTEKARLKITENELLSAKQTLKNNEQKYLNLKKTYESNLKLFKDGAISQSSLDDSKMQTDEAYAAYISSKKALDDGKNIQELRLQQNQIKLMEVEYNTLLKQKEKYFVRSNISGVVADVFVHEGETPELQKQFIYIVDNNNMEVTANVSEYDARAIQTGDKVTITSDGSGDRAYESVVSYISPFARKTDTNQGGSESIVDVKAIIRTEDGLIKSGYNAIVNILCDKKENVLAAPYEAILTAKDGKKYIFVSNKGSIKKYEIKTGIEGSLKVEIISPYVKEGDAVILNPTEDLLAQNIQKAGTKQ